MSKDFQCPPQLRLDYAVADIHFRKRSFRTGWMVHDYERRYCFDR
nr:MAG TPA: hypothetical protein [Caudoviricetes sp.]